MSFRDKNVHETYSGTLIKHFKIQRRARPNFAAFFSVLKIEDQFNFYKLLYLQYDMYYFILVS